MCLLSAAFQLRLCFIIKKGIGSWNFFSLLVDLVFGEDQPKSLDKNKLKTAAGTEWWSAFLDVCGPWFYCNRGDCNCLRDANSSSAQRVEMCGVRKVRRPSHRERESNSFVHSWWEMPKAGSPLNRCWSEYFVGLLDPPFPPIGHIWISTPLSSQIPLSMFSGNEK